MTMQDLNQLTISGHVRTEPELRRFDDGDSPARSRSRTPPTTTRPGTGSCSSTTSASGDPTPSTSPTRSRSDSGSSSPDDWTTYQQSLTGYQSIVSILADRVITMPATAEEPGSYTEQLALS
jgi:hypothetical protein